MTSVSSRSQALILNLNKILKYRIKQTQASTETKASEVVLLNGGIIWIFIKCPIPPSIMKLYTSPILYSLGDSFILIFQSIHLLSKSKSTEHPSFPCLRLRIRTKGPICIQKYMRLVTRLEHIISPPFHPTLCLHLHASIKISTPLLPSFSL